jgi:hypothetical protein
MADMSDATEVVEDVPDVPVETGYTQADFAEAMLQDNGYTQEDFANAQMQLGLEDVSVETPSTPVEPLQITVTAAAEQAPVEDTVDTAPVQEEVTDTAPQQAEEPIDLWSAAPVTPQFATQEEALSADVDFISAARIMAGKMQGNAEFGLPPENATDAQMAEWAISRMGQFNWNMTTMAIDAFSLKDWSAEEIEAFVTVMDKYEALPNFTLSGTGRAVKGILSDPTTYVGIGVLGRLFGITGKESGKAVLRQLVKKGVQEETARKIVQRGVLLSGAALEGGIYSSSDDLLRQSVGVTAGRQEEIDYLQSTKAFGYGALAGPAILLTGYAGIKATRATVDGISNWKASKKAGDIVPENTVDEAVPTTVEAQAIARVDAAEKGKVGDEPLQKPEKSLDEAVDVERKFDDSLDEVTEGMDGNVIPAATKPNKDGRVVFDEGSHVVIEDGHKWIPNLVRLETSEQASRLIFDVARKRTDEMLKRDGRSGGVQSLAQAKKEAKEAAVKLASDSGRDTKSAGRLFDQLIEGHDQDIRSLKEIQARSLVVNEMVAEISERLTKMAKEKKPEQFTNAEKAEFLQLKDTLDALSVMDGLYSRNFARNLGSRRITRGQWDILSTLNKADEMSGTGVDGMINRVRREADQVNDDFVKIHEAVKSSHGNLKLLRKNTKPGVLSKTLQKLVSFRTEAMISGLATQEAAFFGNMINLIKYPILKKIAGRFRGGEAGARLRMEAGVLLSGYRMYANEARKLAIRAYKQGGGITDPAKTQSKIEGYETHKSDPSFIKKLGKFTLFGDLMSGFDEFTKALFTRSEAYSKAYIRVLEMEPNISKADAKKKAEEYVKKLIDPNTGQFKDADLIQTARELSYMQDVNDTVIGRAVSTVANAGGGIGRLLAVPFVKAPLNIVSEGLMFVPGTARITERQSRIISDFRAAKKQLDEMEAGAFPDIDKEGEDLIRRTYEQAAEAKAFLNARKAVGGSVMMGSIGLASQGLLTGNGPTEPEARKLWLKNHKPLSIKIGDTWVSYKGLEPFTTAIALSSDLTDTVMRLSSEETDKDALAVATELMGAVQVLLADTFLTKSMLMGMDQFMEAAQDQKASERFIRSWISSFVPNFVGSLKPDDYTREHYTLANSLAKKVPILDQMVGRRYDDYGRPIESGDYLLGALAISKTFKTPDRVTETLYELRDKYDREGSLSSMSPSLGIVTKGTDFRKVIDESEIGLGESVYSKFHRILGEVELDGMTLHERLEEAIDHPMVANSFGNESYAPPALKYLGNIIRQYRKAALRELEEVSPKYREARLKQHEDKMEIGTMNSSGPYQSIFNN